jgi:hypothetical protein
MAKGVTRGGLGMDTSARGLRVVRPSRRHGGGRPDVVYVRGRGASSAGS